MSHRIFGITNDKKTWEHDFSWFGHTSISFYSFLVRCVILGRRQSISTADSANHTGVCQYLLCTNVHHASPKSLRELTLFSDLAHLLGKAWPYSKLCKRKTGLNLFGGRVEGEKIGIIIYQMTLSKSYHLSVPLRNQWDEILFLYLTDCCQNQVRTLSRKIFSQKQSCVIIFKYGISSVVLFFGGVFLAK